MRTLWQRISRAARWSPLILALACDKADSPGMADSALGGSDRSAPDSVPVAEGSSGWDLAVGSFVVLPTVDGGVTAGSLLLPEAADSTVGDTIGIGALVGDRRVDLFSRGGKVATTRLTVEVASAGEATCSAWPVARLDTEVGVTVAPWTAAFAAGRIVAIPLDSIEGLVSRDSGRLAADLTRLASRLPDDTATTFRGLPFVVLRAWRGRDAENQDAAGFIVATLARRVNQEDNPLEERLVLVVDAPTGNASEWKVGWHERASGHEEELVVAEPLLAFHAVGARDVRLLFGRDDGVALSAAVLSRALGGWRVLWESALAGCD